MCPDDLRVKYKRNQSKLELKLQVSYNPRLIGLSREVRMLSILGFAIPPKILATTDLAKKFARQAKALEQIASFHNTIGDRMITSQVK